MAAHFCGSRAAGRRLRQGRRRAGRGRQQSGRCGLDGAPAAAARRRSRCTACNMPARPRADKLGAIRREIGKLGVDALVLSDPPCGGLDLQHPRRRRRAYAAAAVLCAGAEGRPADHLHRPPQALQQRARPSRADPPTCAEPDALTPTLIELAQERRIDRARQRDRGRRAEPDDHGRRRQAGARQRSDRAAEGGEERDRDQGHADGAPARRRGAGALPRLDRSRGAKRQAHRDRRGRGAGNVPPRHRRAEGRVVPDHIRHRPERRHRALPRHPQEQPADRARRSAADRFRRAI